MGSFLASHTHKVKGDLFSMKSKTRNATASKTKQRVSFYIPNETRNTLRKKARGLGLSTSSFMSQLLTKELTKELHNE